MTRAAAATALAGLACVLLASAALAYKDTRTYGLNLSGESCTATTRAQVRLPRAARLVSVESPEVGDTIAGEKAGFPKRGLAQVTGVEVRRGRITVTVAADPTQCTSTELPGEPVDARWVAAADIEVSYLTPNIAWARSQAREALRSNAGEAFGDPGYYRISCRRRGVARFRCRISAFAGDTVVNAVGTVSIAQDADFARTRFRATYFDEYCALVLKKPIGRCITKKTWR